MPYPITLSNTHTNGRNRLDDRLGISLNFSFIILSHPSTGQKTNPFSSEVRPIENLRLLTGSADQITSGQTQRPIHPEKRKRAYKQRRPFQSRHD